jgi:hypothetical protein
MAYSANSGQRAASTTRRGWYILFENFCFVGNNRRHAVNLFPPRVATPNKLTLFQAPGDGVSIKGSSGPAVVPSVKKSFDQ